ncbi:dienelactone hydrolase family protein [Inquilinus limosus]|uniref:dienelactone hydrolase family protein n=1 Tax=Inquilinus limosus TaxID=171674 RepID=UPI0004210A42|nr:alpha/beta hydrolase [Inquilinus limosus]
MTRDITHPVEIGPRRLQGLLGMPKNRSEGLIIFAHGSGSGRHSPRNNHVAAGLRSAGLATLLLDLLTPEEERDRANVFDIPLLAERLDLATDWAARAAETSALHVGYFGASTGAAAALVAAAKGAARIHAVVSRGGRPDLAGEALDRVRAPTLLLVGSLDEQVLDLNREAYERLPGEKELVVVPGAGHLFEEPGTLDQVVRQAALWFGRYLTGGDR